MTEERRYGWRDLRRCGLTFRQVDYWTRQGWLTGTAPGHGHKRTWSERDAQIVFLAARLIDAGFTTRAAVKHAATAVNHGVGSFGTESGVTVIWHPRVLPTKESA